ncbi:MAG: transglycosylase domain-containing protein [Treponema sp.]|jgi:penicillin-binding protein 1C|nr:transglycosylase domain-containing protein [Treponema sp.]
MSRFVKLIPLILACAFLPRLVLYCIPYPELEHYQKRSYGFAVLDRNGRTLRVFPAEDGVKREWASLAEIPAVALRVFIRAEDRRFYLHPGVDPLAITAAAVRNWRAGHTVSGASTITMQLARLIKPRRSGLAGKAREAFDALRIEARLSKKQILELWINGIPFGSNVEGLPAMMRARFGRELGRLDDTRAALLAVIPRRPGLYDPAINPQAAVSAAAALSRRCRLGLDEAALWEAAAEAAPGPAGESSLTEFAAPRNPFYAPHFTGRAAEIYRNTALPLSAATRRGPLHTTLDLELQLYAEKRLSAELALLENNRVSNGAILALDNESGAVLAYVGSASWFNEEINGKIDGVRVENQPGSCLKPFLYAMALEKGFNPNDILPDIPTVFGGGEAYSPANFNRRFNGPVRLRVALASSLNVPAVYLLERLGVRAFEEYLAGLGFDSISRSMGSNGVGLALGNAEVSLEELVRAFSAFPRGGRAAEPRFIADSPDQPSRPRQVMAPDSAWLISDILADRASRFIGFGPAPALATDFPSIFKTGTANQFQHIWALGATARFTVGVWMGNFSGETVMGRTGSSIPARLTADLLRALEQSAPAETAALPSVPGDMRMTEICALSGMAAGPGCTGTVREWIHSKRLPDPCSWHRRPGTGPVYPPEYQAWLRERFRAGDVQGRGMSFASGLPEGAGNGVYIRIPVSGSVFYVDPGLPPEAQALRIETAGFGPDALVYADGVLQGSLNQAGVYVLPLLRGSHHITVEDESGENAGVEIVVK